MQDKDKKNSASLVQKLFEAPYHLVVSILSGTIGKTLKEMVKQKPREDKFYQNPDLSEFDLVCIEHRGMQLLGHMKNYQLMQEHSVKALYFSSWQIKPIIVEQDDVLEVIGDVRNFVHQHEQELLDIAAVSRIKCPLMLVNVYHQLKQNDKKPTLENIKESKKSLEYHLHAFEYSIT